MLTFAEYRYGYNMGVTLHSYLGQSGDNDNDVRNIITQPIKVSFKAEIGSKLPLKVINKEF